MKLYRVKVNGKVYEVELESVSETVPSKEMPRSNEASSLAQGTELKAPMQGTIINVLIKVGDYVSKGQKLFVLEAMKLENDIVSPKTGIVKQILVQNNQAVNNQDILAVIE